MPRRREDLLDFSQRLLRLIHRPLLTDQPHFERGDEFHAGFLLHGEQLFEQHAALVGRDGEQALDDEVEEERGVFAAGKADDPRGSCGWRYSARSARRIALSLARSSSRSITRAGLPRPGPMTKHFAVNLG